MRHSFLTILFSTFFILPLCAQLKVSKLFSDHAVLQRDQPIKVWGWAKKKASVTISFNGKKHKARSDKQGKWEVTMPAMKAGGPYEMTIKNSREIISFQDILIGDVWICSGQSNMEWTVSNSNDATAEIEHANDKGIRHFKIPKSYAKMPEETLAGGEWQVTNAETIGDFTAVGYYFAKELRKHVDIPIGLLHTSWGGSRVEPWMSAGTLNLGDPKKAVERVLEQAKKEYDAKTAKLKAAFPDLSTEEKGIKNGVAVWANEKIDVSKWMKLKVPEIWEAQGYDGFDGIGWYRTTFDLTEAEAKDKIRLALGQIDDSDITWINGQKVGETIQSWNTQRLYAVPSEILKVGKNTIAIRVEDTGGGGGIHGEATDIYVKTNTQKIVLADEWDFRLDAMMSSNYLNQANQIPTLLYNKMIFPIKNYGIKGALWYQGESNAGSVEDAKQYEGLFADMIQLWRTDFRSGDFPFLYVQLANWLPPQDAGVDSNWATLRASQTNTLKVKNTAQAVIIDIGEADDIHPRNKQDVGLRLSLAARNLAYGEDILYQSPMYQNHLIKGGKIHLTFEHVGDGLSVKNKYGYVNGFAIAGADGKFVWAKAELDGANNVIVWSEQIPEPKYLRYAWADNPDDVNLYNSAGLPACPFQIVK